MKAKAVFLIAIALLCILHPAAAQRSFRRPDNRPLSPAFIDTVVQNLMDSAEVAGLCIGVIAGGKQINVKGYCYKDTAGGAPNDTATSFYAASLAKPLLVHPVMRLVDEGKLSLDKPLYAYLPKSLPEYPAYRELAGDERWKLITARHCLSHTTGFPNWRFLNAQTGAFDTAGKIAIYFTPGERYAYSGEGLVLLQLAVETATGQSLESLAQQKIFGPFGMRRSSFLWQPAFESDYAFGHTVAGEVIPKHRADEANAAGSMETTGADYTRFLSGVLQGKGLSAKSRREMLRVQIPIYTRHQFPSLNWDTTSANRGIELGYGLGWGLFRSRYGQAFFKEGHGEGWQHYAVAFPEKGFALVLMANSDNGESLFTQAVQRLAGVTIPYEWEHYLPFRPVAKLPEAALRQYTGTYEGKLQAVISLENGRLWVESKTVGLPKTALYAADETHFFLKTMEVEILFVKEGPGKVLKAVVDDEGEHYELQKAE